MSRLSRLGTVLLVTKALLILAAFLLAATASGQVTSFEDRVGDTPVGDVVGDGVNEPVQVPFITWGGDVATFHANGGLETAAGSTYADLGLKLNLTPGDDFEQQVRDYLSGESPFLRGTFNMLALASGTIGQDPRTKPVVFLQLT
ncbi:MAG: nitrate ABC transporter substrate-binding protein, partial [Planctomycetota bacterium]